MKMTLSKLLKTSVGKNLKSWEACIPHVEFAYNRTVHSTTDFSPFEIVYGFNPLTPMDLLELPVNAKSSLDGKKKAELVKSIHEKVRIQIEKKNQKTASQMNKGRKKITFHPGDLVWVHLRKERFPAQRKSKLMPRGDGPFRVLERVNDNAYKLDRPGEYGVSATFNIAHLSPFDAGSDSRTNPFEEGGDDVTQQAKENQVLKDPLVMTPGPMTRARQQRIQGALQAFVGHSLWVMDKDLTTLQPLEHPWRTFSSIKDQGELGLEE